MVHDHIGVLGGGGFLGSHLVRVLLDRTDHAILAVDTTFDKLPVTSPRLERIEASIEDPGVLSKVVSTCGAIVSTTALCNPSLYNTRPVEVIHANFTHLVPLVELCTREKRWLIHFSTCEVYGREPPGCDPAPDAPMREDESALVFGPVHKERWTYACAKQLLERLIFAHGRHQALAFTIVRPFNVIGPLMDYIPGVDGEGTPRVLAGFMRSLLFREPINLVDGGHSRRSFVYVDDFTDAVFRVLQRPDACRGEIFNIGNPSNEIRISDLAERMVIAYNEVRGEERRFEMRTVAGEDFYGSGYDDTRRRIPDIRKAERLLGWRPTTTLDEMLPIIVRDYVERYGQAHR